MDPMQTNEGKHAMFVMWVRAGPTKVFFDSGHPEVQIIDRLKNDPEMWVVLTEAKVSERGFRADIRQPTGNPYEVNVPWEAVHTMESAAFDEVHVWATSLRAAEKRKDAGYVKERPN